MDRRFLGILAALVIIFAGFFALNQHNSNKGNGQMNSSAQPTNHIEGQGSTGVKLVEYGDYECPVCADFYRAVNQMEAQFSKQIYFQFRNLPLTQIHQNAFAAARAAEAAGKQGKYFQMHNLLYVNQNDWVSSSNPQSFFDNYAKQLGLNISKFDSDYSSSAVNDAINADIAAFNKTGQQMATPTFFLDGKYVDNSKFIDSSGQPSAQKFADVINAEIAAKTKR